MLTRPLILPTAFGLACALAACGGASDARNGLRGEVREDGSSTLYPVAVAVAEQFGRAYPGVRVSVGVSGTGGGIRRLCSDQIDLANASRAMTPDEATSCRARGVEVIEIPLALDGVTVVARRDSEFLDCLSVEELARLWQPGSAVELWSDLRPDFPESEVHLFGAGSSSGTYDFFTEQIVGSTRASRTDFQASEDDNVIVTSVAGDAQALGFFGYVYFAANAERLRAVAIDDGSGCVRPSPATIADGSYAPLVRTLYLYLNTSSLERPAVQRYVEFLLERVERLVADVGYVALPSAAYAESSARLGRAPS